jgi:hypothetical protein
MSFRDKLANGFKVVILEELPDKIIGAYSDRSGRWQLSVWNLDGTHRYGEYSFRLVKRFDVGDYVTVQGNFLDADDLSFRGVFLKVIGIADDGYEVRCFERGDYFLGYSWDIVKATSENVTNPIAKELLHVLN